MKKKSIIINSIFFTGSIMKLDASIILILFCIINTTYAQSQIGMYCGDCSAERQSLDAAKRELGLAYEYLDAVQLEFDAANKALINAAACLEFANVTFQNAQIAVDIAKKAKSYAENTIIVAKDALAAARRAFILATGAWSIALAAKAVVVAEAALTAAEVALFPVLAAFATAVIVRFDAQQAIPPLQDKYIIAEDEFNKALEKKARALKRLSEAKENEIQKTEELKKCIDKRRTPGQCEKCENDIIVADNSQDPGGCKKCENGAIVNKCTSGQKCCNGTCVNIEYEYLVTVTTVTCDGSSTTSYMSSSCSSGTTGQFEYSFGVCVGGSIVTISCSGPYPVPCEE